MTDNIEVMGIRLDCLTAKETMVRAMQFMENDSVDIIEILSMDVLMKNSEDEQWKALIQAFQLALPGDQETLRAAGINDRGRLKETGDRTFFRLFMKYLQKNHNKTFLLAETEEELDRAERALGRYVRDLKLTGKWLLSDDGREENVVNEINGTETDCILSFLPSPYQEQFIDRNKALLSAKVWFGCGAVLGQEQEKRLPTGRIRRLFRKLLFWWRTGKEQ